MATNSAAAKLKAMLEKRKNENKNQESTKEIETPKLLGSNDSETNKPDVEETSSQSDGGISEETKSEIIVSSNSNNDVEQSPKIELEQIESETDRSHPVFQMIDELKEAQDNNLPNFHTILRDIHLFMAKDPEIQTILPDAEIGIIVSGLKKVQGDVQLAAPKGSTKKRAPIEAGML